MWKSLETPVLLSHTPQPSQVNWQLAQPIQAREGWPALLGPHSFPLLHFADGVTESREGRMAKANQLMNPSFLPHSAVTQALLSLSSAKSRAWGGGGCLGKWLRLRGCHGNAAGC